MASVNAWGWVDLTLLGLLVLSVLVGIWRGLVFELMSLIGWVVAYVAAQMFAPQAAALLPMVAPGSTMQHVAGFALVFLGVLVVWSLLARLVRFVVHATPLTALDRLLGAGFGLLRGGVVLLVVATVVAVTPAAHSAAWQGSLGAAWLAKALQGIKPALPAELAQRLTV